MKKYGFVYIWYDLKHKRYYIGSHWGTEDDGYICSSSWMKKAYKIRSNDFKRRIIARIYTNKSDLLNEEYRWFSFINPIELKTKYYNLNLSICKQWWSNPEQTLTVGQKITNANIGRKQTFKDPVERGRKISEGKKLAFDKCREETGSAFTPEHLIKIGQAHLGKKHTEEWKQQNSKKLKEQWASGQRVGKPRTNKPLTKIKISLKDRWADPVWRETQINKLKEGSKRRYTKV